MKFNCTGCGICCTKVRDAFQNVDKMLPADRDAIQYFPYAVKADGSCEKFQDGKCTVYEKRPLICNMERMYNKYYRPANVPKKVFYDMAGNACNSLILQNGGSEKQLVKPH